MYLPVCLLVWEAPAEAGWRLGPYDVRINQQAIGEGECGQALCRVRGGGACARPKKHVNDEDRRPKRTNW